MTEESIFQSHQFQAPSHHLDPTGRGERADNTEQLPSRLHPSSSTTQGKERQRGDAIVLLMSPGSGVTKQILLPPSLPPGVAWLPPGKLLQSSQLSWPEAAREEIPPSLLGWRPCPRELHQGCHQRWALCLQDPAACAVSSHTGSTPDIYCSLSFQPFCFSEPLISLL